MTVQMKELQFSEVSEIFRCIESHPNALKRLSPTDKRILLVVFNTFLYGPTNEVNQLELNLLKENLQKLHLPQSINYLKIISSIKNISNRAFSSMTEQELISTIENTRERIELYERKKMFLDERYKKINSIIEDLKVQLTDPSLSEIAIDLSRSLEVEISISTKRVEDLKTSHAIKEHLWDQTLYDLNMLEEKSFLYQTVIHMTLSEIQDLCEKRGSFFSIPIYYIKIDDEDFRRKFNAIIWYMRQKFNVLPLEEVKETVPQPSVGVSNQIYTKFLSDLYKESKCNRFTINTKKTIEICKELFQDYLNTLQRITSCISYLSIELDEITISCPEDAKYLFDEMNERCDNVVVKRKVKNAYLVLCMGLCRAMNLPLQSSVNLEQKGLEAKKLLQTESLGQELFQLLSTYHQDFERE